MAGPWAEAGTSRYLPILIPIGAIDGMFGYGSAASPGALVASADRARGAVAQAKTLHKIERARRNLRLVFVAVR